MNFKETVAVAIDEDLQEALVSNPPTTLVPGPVYSKAIYLTWPGYGPVVLLGRSEMFQPWALVTDKATFAHVETSRLKVSVSDGCVCLGNQRIVVVPNKTTVYDSHLPDLSATWNTAYLDEARVLGWGAKDASVFNHLGPLEHEVRLRVANLLQGLKVHDVGEVRMGVRQLVGFGYGGTPTGDDFLAGLLSALKSSGQNREFDLLARIVQELSLLDSAWTTVPASVSLWHAHRGYASQAVVRTLLAINGIESADAFRQLIQVGHTSGRDILSGLIIGSVWQ